MQDGPYINADGERWLVTMDAHAPHEGVRAIVFNCVSNPQRPWHVTEVAENEFGSSLQGSDENRLRALFDDSQPMDYTHGDERDAHQAAPVDDNPLPTDVKY